MKKLLEGIVRFKQEDFEEHKHLFSNLKRAQTPHTLFIGCSDSRVVPELITKTMPGELFVIRNIANIVPSYRETQEYVSTTSGIEYAVNVLNVQNIVVCGHSNCGGCASMYLPESVLAQTPHTRKWLELTRHVKERVLQELNGQGEDVREWMTEQINVIEQIKHLLSYPFIKEKCQNKEINILGWYYIIETGEVFVYNSALGEFQLAN
ncbi:MAG: carbonic anhydrase [Desulfitobacterium hafniense]|nr:carbonic anhydrase [Desulfitobacterium hafniense]